MQRLWGLLQYGWAGTSDHALAGRAMPYAYDCGGMVWNASATDGARRLAATGRAETFAGYQRVTTREALHSRYLPDADSANHG